MAVTIENVTGGTYNGSGASPNSGGGGITTSGPNRTVVIMCRTSRANVSADINQVTAISAAGLTFTRVLHDVSWTYSDPGAGGFPVASHSVDVFTAPAAVAQTGLSWTSTVSGDGFVNAGSFIEFAVAGLADITNPFDTHAGLPVINTNNSGTGSAPANTVSTNSTIGLLLQFINNHTSPSADAAASATSGWTAVTGTPFDNSGAACGAMLFAQTKQTAAPQSGLVVTAPYTDLYWSAVMFAFAGASVPAFTQSKAAVIC